MQQHVPVLFFAGWTAPPLDVGFVPATTFFVFGRGGSFERFSVDFPSAILLAVNDGRCSSLDRETTSDWRMMSLAGGVSDAVMAESSVTLKRRISFHQQISRYFQ